MRIMNYSECVICLSQLQGPDNEFPLLCPRKCSNICTNCSSHLKLKHTNGGDDNNNDTLVSCPNCKASIKYQAIVDTHFMRYVRKLEYMVIQGTPDSEMSGAELRMKYSVTPTQIESTKERLEAYRSGAKSSMQPLSTSCSTQQQQEPKIHSCEISDKIDTALLNGLDAFMSEEEQIYITELMTSGITRKLAQGAQILSEIKHVHDIDSGQNYSTNPKPIISLWSRSLPNKEKRAMKMAEPSLKDLYTMPKCVVLKADFDVYARKGKVLKFKDDTWDGTMADAFARVYVSNSNSNIHGDPSENYESQEEDEFGDEEGFLNDNVNNKKNRVIVTCARKQATKMGIKEGDVVTHVNADEFLGTAEDLRSLIKKFYLDEDVNSFSMVLNAEQSTADSLKKRAKVY